MRLARIEAAGFRGWRAGELALGGPLTLLVGTNGTGKSSTLNAVEWCLYGRQVEKKDSGIDERGDWEAQHRAAEGAVQVRLVFETEAGPWELTRRRAAGAGAREADALTMNLPGGETLAGEAASERLAAAGFPDWDTWHRAHCQHQERARRRLIEVRDRSTVLAALLGLDAYDLVHRELKDANPGRLVRQLDDELAALDAELLQRLASPAEELEECEARLVALGVERARIGPELGLERARGLIERARGLAARAGSTLEPPRCEGPVDVSAVAEWARAWSASARGELDLGARLQSQARRGAELAAELERLRPAEERWRRARAALDEELRRGGEAAAREREQADAERALEALEARQRRRDATRALLSQARELLAHAEHPGRCPVCASDAPELGRRLDEQLAEGSDSEARELEAERARHTARRDSLREDLRALEQLAREESDARAQVEAARARLGSLIPAARLEQAADPAAAARAELEETQARTRELERAARELDEALEAQRRDLEVLRELARWQAAAGRAERRADLREAPGHAELERALDEAAGLAVDLSALADLARELQEERSAARVEEVEARLGRYLERITSDARPVRVQVKRSARGLKYELVDEHGATVLPILNQAAMNALALALLFAQAEARADAGLPAWVLLDDPGQSLDAAHQQGLARALAALSERCQVLVAAPPGPLADALEREGAEILKLARYDERHGVRVETEAAP